MVNNTGGLPQLGSLCVGLLLEVDSPPMHRGVFSRETKWGGMFIPLWVYMGVFMDIPLQKNKFGGYMEDGLTLGGWVGRRTYTHPLYK